MISLHPLDRRDADRVAHIAARPDQQQFAETVEAALAVPAATIDLHEIRLNHRPIGVFRIDRAYHLAHDFAGPRDLGLRGVILDAAMQGRGVGKRAMQVLGPYVARRYPDADRLYLTVNFRNPVAIAVYARAGFRDEGGVWLGGSAGPQHIMCLPLPKA